MIGRLRGKIEVIEEDQIILDVNGVGYLIFCSGKTLSELKNIEGAVSLLIETHVREDHIHLYGFINKFEHKIFLELVKVSGVGNKMAMALLSTLTPDQIITAISAGDKSSLTLAPGVGPKLAARLLTELKDKLGSISFTPQSANVSLSTPNNPKPNLSYDAISALVNLGYNRSDAYVIINKLIAGNDNISIDELIKQSLKELTKL